jgi:hypothetical protein
MKKCTECQKDLPDHSFHVFSDGRKHSKCKPCRAEYERKRRAVRKTNKMESIESDVVESFCKAARMGGSTIPHSAELVETIMGYMGGVQGFSNLFMKQYLDSPPGGAHRTRMLDTLVRLVKDNTAMGGAKKPLDLMSEEELDSELRRQVLEAAIQVTKVEVVDAVRKLPLVGSEPTIRDGFVQEVPADMGEERRGATPSNDADQQLRGME